MSFGATILDAEGLRLSRDEIALFRDADPFGFILFARNLDTPDQIRALCDDFRAAVGRDAPILIDQEGGRVQRLRPPLARDWAAPLEFVTRAGDIESACRAIHLRYRLIADELRALGIDANCAPMVDVAGPNTHDFLKNRCYGTDPASVAQLGASVAAGLLEGGVLPVLKHIPGHGGANADSHLELPVVADDLATLRKRDFAPFKDLNDLPMGMTAHVVYSALDDAPATLSTRTMRVIREEIGFGGLVMTDDIGMKALSGSLADLSRKALAAGCDVILHCNGTFAERAAVAQAAGRLSPAGQARAQAALACRVDPQPFDAAAAEGELEGLLGTPRHG